MEHIKLEIILHHGTGTYWDRKMVSAEMKDVLKEVKDYMRGVSE